jgi:hypothetical protein
VVFGRQGRVGTTEQSASNRDQPKTGNRRAWCQRGRIAQEIRALDAVEGRHDGCVRYDICRPETLHIDGLDRPVWVAHGARHKRVRKVRHHVQDEKDAQAIESHSSLSLARVPVRYAMTTAAWAPGCAGVLVS